MNFSNRDHNNIVLLFIKSRYNQTNRYTRYLYYFKLYNGFVSFSSRILIIFDLIFYLGAMVTVRGKQRNKRRGIISRTNHGKIRKKEYMKRHKVIITNEIVRQNWDKEKTVKENFADLGLVSDPNSTYRTTHNKKKPVHEEEELELGDVEEYKEKEVVKKLEEQSKTGAPNIRHFSPAESELWEGLIGQHGSDYKAMARDKRNTHQHTPKQIKRKIESYLTFRDSEHKTKMGCVG